MVVGFTTTYAIGAYHHWWCEFESRSGRGVQHYKKNCQWLAEGQWFSSGTMVSSINKIDHHDIAEVLLKNPNPNPNLYLYNTYYSWTILTFRILKVDNE